MRRFLDPAGPFAAIVLVIVLLWHFAGCTLPGEGPGDGGNGAPKDTTEAPEDSTEIPEKPDEKPFPDEGRIFKVMVQGDGVAATAIPATGSYGVRRVTPFEVGDPQLISVGGTKTTWMPSWTHKIAPGWTRVVFDPSEAGEYEIVPVRASEGPPPYPGIIQFTVNGKVMGGRVLEGILEGRFQDLWSHEGGVTEWQDSAGDLEVRCATWHLFPGDTWHFVRVVNTVPYERNGNFPVASHFGEPTERDLTITFDLPAMWAEKLDEGLARDYALRTGEGVGFWFYEGQKPELVLPATLDGFAGEESQRGTALDTMMRTALAGLKDDEWHGTRNWGDRRRDFEGSGTSSHNGEYDWYRGCALAAMRFYGENIAFDALEMAVAGAWHQATVDRYHLETGAFSWMNGAPFQHPKHGGSGEGHQHRSTFHPNAGHWVGHSMRIAWLLTGGNSLIGWSADHHEKWTKWKIDNGPGMPSMSDLGKEARGPAYQIWAIANRVALFGEDDYRETLERAIAESSDRTYFRGQYGSGRCKPWMILQLGSAYQRCVELGIMGAITAEAGVARFIMDQAQSPGKPNLLYEWDSTGERTRDNDMPGSFWNTLAADFLVEINSGLAQMYYQEAVGGSGWYRNGDGTVPLPTKYPNLLVASMNLIHGHRYEALGSPPAPMARAMAAQPALQYADRESNHVPEWARE